MKLQVQFMLLYGEVNIIKVITQNDLINIISEQTRLHKYLVKKIIKSLNIIIPCLLRETTKDEGIEVKLTDGVVIGCEYVDSYEYFHPGIGGIVESSPKIKAYSRITKYFNQMLNKK